MMLTTNSSNTSEMDRYTLGAEDRIEMLSRFVTEVVKANFSALEPTSAMVDATMGICGKTLTGFSNQTLVRLCNPTLNNCWLDTVAQGVFMLWDDQMVNDFLDNALELQGEHKVTNPNGLNAIRSYLKLLNHYKELAPVTSEKTSERSHQTAAILRVTWHVLSEGSDEIREAMKGLDVAAIRDIPYINDAKLRNLIANSDYDSRAVAVVITERHIYDADHIIAILEGPHTPLVNGIL